METRPTGDATGGVTEAAGMANGTEAAGVTEATEAVGCRGLTEGRRRTGAISSSSSSEIVIGEWETVVSSSSEITIVEWVLAGMTEGTGATGVTEATDAVGARGAGATDLERSCSMKCV